MNDNIYRRALDALPKSKQIDLDIFHDTYIKCLDKVNNLKDEEKIKYICKAYLINIIRDKQYARNKCVELTCENSNNHYINNPEHIDINNIKLIISEKFSEELCNLFFRYINGEPIVSIEKSANITGLSYQFKKIKEYLKKTKIINELKNLYGF